MKKEGSGTSPQGEITKAVPANEQLGDHSYYKEGEKGEIGKHVDDLEREGQKVLESGRRIYDSAKDRAEKKFGGFFSKVRDSMSTVANAIAKAAKVGLGGGVAFGKGTVEVGKFVGKEAYDIASEDWEVVKAGGRTVRDVAIESTATAVAGGLELAMGAEDAYKSGKEYASQKAIEAEKLAIAAKDATIR